MASIRRAKFLFFWPTSYLIMLATGAAEVPCIATPVHSRHFATRTIQEPLNSKVNDLVAKLHYGETLLNSGLSTQAIHLAYQAYQTASKRKTPIIRLQYYSLAAQLALTGSELAQNVYGMPSIKAFTQQAEIALAEKSLKHMVPLLKIVKPHRGSGFRRMTYAFDEINGRIALSQGNYDRSCAFLRESGRVPGDSAMASFGPDLSLAESLLLHGYRSQVAKFLVEVGKYWHPASILAKTLSAGKIPVFSSQNVAYNLEPAGRQAP